MNAREEALSVMAAPGLAAVCGLAAVSGILAACGSPAGDTLRVLRRGVEPPRVTPEERDSALAVVEERYRDATGGPPPGSVELPEVKPVIADLQVDPRGNLWIRHPSGPGAPRVDWSVHDPEGRYLGTVALPPMAVHQVGEDFVAGVERDDLGVQRVAVRPIVRP